MRTAYSLHISAFLKENGLRFKASELPTSKKESSKLLTLTCVRHRTVIHQSYGALRNTSANGCPECKHENYSKSALSRIERLGNPRASLTRREVQKRIDEKFGKGKIKITAFPEGTNKSEQAISLKHSCGYNWDTKIFNVLKSKVGCPVCGKLQADDVRRKSLRDYNKELKEIDCNTLVALEYLGDSHYASHKCTTCGHEQQYIPNRLLNGLNKGCRSCKSNGSAYSKVSQSWLKALEDKHGIELQSAFNQGEFVVKCNGKNYRVDGYDARHKVVYEFLGSTWHGSLSTMRSSLKPHPYCLKIVLRVLPMDEGNSRRTKV